MKKYASSLAVLAVLSLSSACVTEKESSLDVMTKEIVFTSTIQDTKTNVMESGEDRGKVTWNAGDRIVVWDGTAQSVVVLEEGDISQDGKTATIRAGVDASAQSFSAIYDADGSASFDESGNVLVNTSAETDGSFAAEHVAVASTDASTKVFNFSNANSMLRFVVPQEGVSKVVIFANADETVKSVTVNPADMQKTLSEEGIASITVNTLPSEAGKSYFVGMPAGMTFSKGLTFSLYDADGTFLGNWYFTKELVMPENQVLNVGNVAPADRNLVRGGSFNDADAALWTCVNSDGGGGKGKGVRPEQASIRDGRLKFTITERCYHTFYQKVHISQAGQYKFDVRYYNSVDMNGKGRFYMALSDSHPVTDVTFWDSRASFEMWAKVENVEFKDNVNFFGWKSDNTGMSPETSAGTSPSRQYGMFDLSAGDYYIVLGAEIWTASVPDAYFDEFSITKVVE